jgi:hypothetical protein
MYRSLGGIAPAAPGYAAVKIAPVISPTRDPASANATVQTVRGAVASRWERHAVGACTGGEFHRAGANCAAWPSVLTENAYQRSELGPQFVPTLCNLCPGDAEATTRQLLVTMRVTVPVGMKGEVHLPLLGRDPR